MRGRFLILTFFFVLLSFTLTGCFAADTLDLVRKSKDTVDIETPKSLEVEETSDSEEYVIPGEYARGLLIEIIECLKNKDKERLRSFKYYSGSLPSYSEIEEAFDFIDGEIIAYSEIRSTGGSHYNYGELKYTSYDADTSIVTDKGMEYDIWIAGRLNDMENPNKVGIAEIKLSNNNIVWTGIPSYGWWRDWKRYKEFFIILGDPNN